MNPRPAASRRISLWLVGTVAAVTPSVWTLTVMGAPSLDGSLLVALLGPSIVSAAFWTAVASWLLRERQKGLGAALGLGIVSPLICLPLCVVIAPLLLLLDAFTQAWGASAWMGFYGFALLLREPLWFFPVGASMGLFVWLVARWDPSGRVAVAAV